MQKYFKTNLQSMSSKFSCVTGCGIQHWDLFSQRLILI